MTRISRTYLLSATFAVLWAAQPAWPQKIDDLPSTDSEIAPQPVTMVPQAVPRSINVADAFTNDNILHTPPLEIAALLTEDAEGPDMPMRMGIVQGLTAREASVGKWTKLEDGGWLYTLVIVAEGAHAARLRVSHWNPPDGAELITYSPDFPEYAVGPVTRDWLLEPGELWTPTVYGERVFVEYYLPKDVDHTAADAQLVIDGVLNQYLAIGDPENAREVGCHRDVGCYSQWSTAAAGVGLTSFVGGGNLPGGFYCSSAMLARIGGDFTPLLMTASHCRMINNNASNLEVTWTYQSPGCGGPTPDPNMLPRSRGVAQLINDPPTDWMLIGLESTNLGGVTFEGWDTNAWANGSTATGIHHPDRSYKRISFGTKLDNSGSRPEPVNQTTCIGGTSYHVRYTVGNGLTEPGSSGSPIFDTAQRVRGVLSCGSAVTCSGDNDGNYGRLDSVFPTVQAYLDPVDPVYVNWSYGGFERGTVAQPVNRFVEGVFAVLRGHNLFIQAGSYNERLTIDKAMTLNASGGTVTIGQ